MTLARNFFTVYEKLESRLPSKILRARQTLSSIAFSKKIKIKQVINQKLFVVIKRSFASKKRFQASSREDEDQLRKKVAVNDGATEFVLAAGSRLLDPRDPAAWQAHGTPIQSFHVEARVPNSER